MIRRSSGTDWLLTTQNDHAIFAGQLARHFGNGLFDPPALRDSVLSAITLHDSGWPLHDDAPTLNSTGQPLHVFEIPLTRAVVIWAASAERAAVQSGDYSGLLVSLHQLGLSALARQHMTPDRPDARQLLFELNKFQQKQIERQERLRQNLGFRTDLPLNLGIAAAGSGTNEDDLRRNFRWLTLADRLSLQLCCGKMLFPEFDDLVPHAGDDPIVITMRFIGDNELVLDPWPFDKQQIAIAVPARRLPAIPFEDEANLREAYAAAKIENVTYELRAM